MSLSYQPLMPGQSGWQSVEVPVGRGISVSLDVFEHVSEHPGPSALVVAGVHGDEYEGPAAIADLASRLAPQSLQGSIRLIPVANPFAFAAGTRISPIDGINLARVFPGKEEGSPTEQLAHVLFHEFAIKADYLIDLHSGGVEYEFLPVAGFYGEARDENPSFRAATAMGLPALWQLPETPGVFSREVTRAGKVATGAEYLGAGRLSKEGAEAYTRAVQSCLELWQLLKPSGSLPVAKARVFTNDWLLATATGLFQSQQRLGDQVRAGDPLSAIAGRRGEVLAQIIAPHEGVVLGLRSKAHVAEGNWAVLLGRELS
ncbi:MAG: succinylglutamate desuccinylase/aspartoacylase family protein [Acidobacteria bacterium]|nr:succinylglutamate desuccinylase/aspartoacylase family protein [Acidobacteriota bacterium]MCI0625557.1 succinylglutamate desuccinylase/aspartoacylase family protein [Acidobacteriota bacterium]MCI0719558.1 succinylglutamate desuccinylase/aspartoacylase family protein [Acidobacteriota bacterium]